MRCAGVPGQWITVEHAGSTRPLHALRLVAERHAMPRRDNHDRIIQLARVAQGGQHAADLRIDIARRTAIAAREAFLIAVIKRCAVKRNPENQRLSSCA